MSILNKISIKKLYKLCLDQYIGIQTKDVKGIISLHYLLSNTNYKKGMFYQSIIVENATLDKADNYNLSYLNHNPQLKKLTFKNCVFNEVYEFTFELLLAEEIIFDSCIICYSYNMVINAPFIKRLVFKDMDFDLTFMSPLISKESFDNVKNIMVVFDNCTFNDHTFIDATMKYLMENNKATFINCDYE